MTALERQRRRIKDKGTNRDRQRWMVAELPVQEAKVDQIKTKVEDVDVDKLRQTVFAIGPLGQSWRRTTQLLQVLNVCS